MLILKIALIYMLVGVLYEVWAFHAAQKYKPEGYEDVLRSWRNLSIWIRFATCIAVSLKWPRFFYIDITDALHRLIAKHRIHLIDKELERRKRNES